MSIGPPNYGRVSRSYELTFPICQKVIDSIFQANFGIDRPLSKGFSQESSLSTARRDRSVEEESQTLEIESGQVFCRNFRHTLETTVIRYAPMRAAHIAQESVRSNEHRVTMHIVHESEKDIVTIDTERSSLPWTADKLGEIDLGSF